MGESLNRVTAKRGSADPPQLIYLAVTDRCFLPCVHCNMWQHRGVDLPTREWFTIIDRLADWCLDAGLDNRGTSLHFVGGEPLMRKDLESIMERAAGKGFVTAICTNGWLVSPARARSFGDSGLSYAYVSLDGATSATVDATRGKAGSYEMAVTALSLLAEQPTTKGVVSCLLHAKNAHEFPDLISFARNNGYFIMSQVLAETLAEKRPDPRWWEKSPLWPHSAKERGAIASAIDLLLGEKQCSDIVINTVQQLESSRCYYDDPSKALPMGCPAGSTECAIDSRGLLRMCFYRDQLGSVLESKDLQALWNSNLAPKHREEITNCLLTCRLNTSNLARLGKERQP